MSRYHYRMRRFNDWYFAWINAHLDGLSRIYTDKNTIVQHCLSKVYEGEFDKGNEDAIFEFIRSDGRAVEARWVGRQITKCKTRGSPNDVKKLRKLFFSIRR
jgi:hypothetical protein